MTEPEDQPEVWNWPRASASISTSIAFVICFYLTSIKGCEIGMAEKPEAERPNMSGAQFMPVKETHDGRQ